MSEAFITRRGGAGSGKAFAVVGVTYPSGATVTCTNGTKTLTTKDTTGTALFVIPSAGTWTVTAVNGSQSTSKSVSITSEGQVESVTLSFELVLFDGGVVSGYAWDASYNDTAYADSKVSDVIYMYGMTYDNGYVLKTSSAERGISTAIDLTSYSTLKVRLKSVESSAGTAKIQVGSTSLGDDAATATVTLTAGTVSSLDISAVTGSKYISLLAASAGGTYANIIKVNFDKVWLE